MKQILFFSATWCGPCNSFKPTMQRLSQTYPVKFIDVDSDPQLVAKYGIRSVPTVVVTHNEREIARKSGVLTEEQVIQMFGN